MEMFMEKAASKASLGQRKLVCGVGINDAWYSTSYKNKTGQWVQCPYYNRWCGMLERAYGTKYQEKYPTYVGCTVSEEWLLFSNFRSWMEKQDWEGKQLDKDILVPDNKVYGGETCIFVSSGINNLLIGNGASRGKYPQGVYWNKRDSRYVAMCRVKGVQKNVGSFRSEREAELAYCTFKANLIISASNEKEASSDLRVKNGLLLHAKKFTDRVSALGVILDEV